jgi:hypothetical protein
MMVQQKLAALLVLLVCISATTATAQNVDDARRAAIAAEGRKLFKGTSNHCRAYVDLVRFATTKVDGPGPLLEDLKYVLVGTGLRQRGTGPHYIGNTPGARGDTGFKSELRDGSPQVEHSWAAIYVGKMGPGAGELLALRTEVMGPLRQGGELNSADILLWSLGADTGQRLSASNYKELPNVLQRTQCQ